jgi:hypothetical protein
VGTAVLVSAIIEEVRTRLDLPTITSTTFINTTNSLNLVKYSARRLGAIIRRVDSDYFLTTATLTTIANVNEVSLPDNFSDLRSLAWMRSTNERVPLELASVDDFDATSEDGESWQSAPRYRLTSGVVMLFPKPNAAYSLSVYYDTGIYVSATTDIISCQPGWDEWIVLDVASRVRTMEEKDAADILAERAKVEFDIVKQASSRDKYMSHQVRDLWEGGDFIDSRSLWMRR